MSRLVQDIAVIDYQGPQGNKELTTIESANPSRTKSKARVKTMNRGRRAIAFQTGTKEVSMTLTVVPELGDPEINWVQAWDDEEEFTLTVEKGLNGVREQFQDCQVSDVADTFNEAGEARQEVTVEALQNKEEPS